MQLQGKKIDKHRAQPEDGDGNTDVGQNGYPGIDPLAPPDGADYAGRNPDEKTDHESRQTQIEGNGHGSGNDA